MDLNKQIRKIVVSEKVYKKISQNLANALIMSGYEIEVVPEITAELAEKEVILVAENIETADYDIKDYGIEKLDEYVTQESKPVKQQKIYVPRTIGKPIKKKGGR
ncbi:MAG: hypothetical protein IJW75_05790 [Alphaproteobacteria bacterium]|nr:hypothetical protein [Alphaproteobacteria bacterium]